MMHLILVVVALALTAAAAAAVVNYTPYAALERHKVYTEAKAGFVRAEDSVIRYLDLNRDEEGFIIFPGVGVDLANVVSPGYGYLPAPVAGKFNWSVEGGVYQGMEAVGICLVPPANMDASLQEALQTVRSRLPVGSAVLASNCFAGSHNANGAHLTYWVILNHIE